MASRLVISLSLYNSTASLPLCSVIIFLLYYCIICYIIVVSPNSIKYMYIYFLVLVLLQYSVCFILLHILYSLFVLVPLYLYSGFLLILFFWLFNVTSLISFFHFSYFIPYLTVSVLLYQLDFLLGINKVSSYLKACLPLGTKMSQ